LSTRADISERHNQLARATADMKRALDAIGAIRIVDFTRGSFVSLYTELAVLDGVHRTLATLLQRQDTTTVPVTKESA
jgi:hypothetical protein